ncbi:unnamed protein product [Rangifer tarandus platyrhynchus]|uniref:Uncharacterized protein n=1 Tax=Rangifer tarandus platyrhynchus TaxID=3082113 RepID=A0AC59ZS43_RANTA
MAASEQAQHVAAAGSVWEGGPSTGRPAVSQGRSKVVARARVPVAGGAHSAGSMPLALLVGPTCACLSAGSWRRRGSVMTAAVTSVVFWPKGLLSSCRPCEYLEAVSTGFKVVVTGCGHKVAAFLPAQLRLLGHPEPVRNPFSRIVA